MTDMTPPSLVHFFSGGNLPIDPSSNFMDCRPLPIEENSGVSPDPKDSFVPESANSSAEQEEVYPVVDLVPIQFPQSQEQIAPAGKASRKPRADGLSMRAS